MFVEAALPEGRRTRNASTETDHTAWIRPGETTSRHDQGVSAVGRRHGSRSRSRCRPPGPAASDVRRGGYGQGEPAVSRLP
ncbi:hypothetical protein Scel_33900 [Streptomyces cellostaticus]|nr:hypothetical protein Scel_33900 [Streptomyces cellostaticus]